MAYRQVYTEYPMEDVSITKKLFAMERTSTRFQLSETAKNSLIVFFIFAALALVSYLQWRGIFE
jgi:hypothetical protein